MPQVDKDKNLSQKLRSNAPLFWKFVAEKIPLQFNYWKSYQGMIMGDSHEGNFVIDRRNSPLFKLDYINGDRDDAGLGPYAFDFAHYVLSVMSETDKINIFSLLDAYSNGLSGFYRAMPTQLESRLNIPNEEYEDLRMEFINKNIQNTHFYLRPGKLDPFDSIKLNLTQSEIETALVKVLKPGQFIIDYAIRPKERGGSLMQRRIWILLRDEQTDSSMKFRIFELKEKGNPAVEFISQQDSIAETWSHSAMVFVGVDTLPLIRINNSFFIWREKKVSILDSPDAKKNFDFYQDLAIYNAYILGLWHRQQVKPIFIESFNSYKQIFNKNNVDLIAMIDWLKINFFKELESQNSN